MWIWGKRKDELWTTKDGRRLTVGEMSESHVRNTLRMLIRNHRRKQEEIMQPAHVGRQLLRRMEFDPDWIPPERPDNHAILAQLRREHGAMAVTVVPKLMAGMPGSDVYVHGKWRGWYGGI